MPRAKIQHSYRQLWLGLLGEHSKEKEGQNIDRPGEIYFKNRVTYKFHMYTQGLNKTVCGQSLQNDFFKAEIPMTKMGKGKLQFFITCT